MSLFNYMETTIHKHLGTLILCLISLMTQAQTEITFSSERGFYNSPISVTISSPNDPNATFRYTTNNSKPSTSVGQIYTGPINISSSKTIRAIAYSSADTTDVITHSYIFPSDIINQGYMYNYITNNPTYGPLMETSLKSIPSISLVTNFINSNDPVSTEVEVSAEMIFPNGKEGFMVNCGLQTWGGSPTNPKKSYRLEFKSKYGTKKLEYDVFDTDEYEDHIYRVPPVKEFDKLLLRSGSQDGLNGEFGNDNLAQFVRNRTIMDAAMELGYPSSHGRYVHVYVNSEYMGQYHLMERPDESWFESYFGDDKDNYEVRRSFDDFWNGNGNIYTALPNRINLNSASAIANTNNYIDLDNAANYLMMMSYLSGYDWTADQNALCGGNITPGVAPYKFILWDTDLAMGNGGKWHPSYSGDINFFNAPTRTGPVPANLVGNAEFDLIMADKMQCACFDGGILTPFKIDSLYNSRIAQIDTSVIAEAARWGDYTFTVNGAINKPKWSPADFNSELNRMNNNYFPQRTAKLIQEFKRMGIYPSVNGVSSSLNGGIVAAGTTITLNNTNGSGTIYYTIDGSDPRVFNGGISQSAMAYTGAISLPAGVYDLKARVRRSGVWSAMCPKRFYVGQEYSNLRFNEIHYNPIDSILPNGNVINGKEFEFVELHNRGTSDIFLTDLIIDKGITVVFDEGDVIPAGGFLVLAEDATNFQLKYGFAPDYVFDGKLDNGGEELRLLSPDLKTIDKVKYDDSLPWDPAPDNGYFSLAVIDPFTTNNSPVNWSEQKVFYTPGATNIFNPNAIPNYNGIVINEIHYNPNDSILPNGDTIAKKRFEFVELKNTTGNLIFLTDVEFTEGVQYKFKDNSFITPFGFITLAKDSMWFHERYGMAPFDEFKGQLSNNIDSVWVQDVFGNFIDSLVYTNSVPWDPIPNNGDYSLALIDATRPNENPINWSEQDVFVTPNAENTFNSNAYKSYNGLVINELHYAPSSGINGEFIELKNTSNNLLQINDISISGGIDYTFPSQFISIPPGQFKVIANNAAQFQSIYGFSPDGEYTRNLSNVGETVRIEDFFGRVIDEVTYSNLAPWDTDAAGGQYSLALIDPSLNRMSPANWSNQDVFVTPKAENTFGNDILPDYSGLVINEIHYSPADSISPSNQVIPGSLFDFIEIKNTGTTDIALTGVQFSSGIDYTFDDNDVIAAGGFVVLAKNATWFANKFGVSPTDTYTGQLADGGEKIELQDFFSQSIDRVTYSPLFPWDEDVVNSEFSLALIDANLVNTSSVNWSNQDVMVSPFAENTFGPDAKYIYGDIVINEIHYAPADSITPSNQTIAGSFFEFIELKNNSQVKIPLADISFTQGVSFDFGPNDFIAPNQIIVLAQNASYFNAKYGMAPSYTYSGTLNDVSGTIALTDFFGSSVDLVSYSRNSPWPVEPGQYTGISAALKDASLNNNAGVNWDKQDIDVSPFLENSFGCPNDLTELNGPTIASKVIHVDQYIQTNGMVNNPEIVLYKAGNYISLEPLFEVKSGAIFEARIEDCL